MIENPEDDLAVLRIINVPRRGIGAATINKVQDWEAEQGIRFYDALLEAEYVPGLMRSLNKIKSFTSFLQVLRAKADYLSVKELLNEIIEETGYVADLQAEGTEEAAARIENIDELISKIADYEESAEQPSLGGFLQEVALVSDIDSVDEESDYVLLMTLHSAKGLEFPNVFLAGMEDGIFPSYMTITGDDPSELEEERRLCYVGITRAASDIDVCPPENDPRRSAVQQDVPFCQRDSAGADFPGAGARGDRRPEAEDGHYDERQRLCGDEAGIPREAAAGENLQRAEGDETRLRNRGYGAPYQVRCRHCHGYRGRRKRL